MKMALFDVSKHTIPSLDEIDMDSTKKNFEIFIRRYKDVSERVGQPRSPKVTQSFSLIPPSFSNEFHSSVEELILRREADQEEFNELYDLFLRGFTAISHPIKSDVTIRRRQVFLMRFMDGSSVDIVMNKLHIGWDTVTEDSKEAMFLFAHALGLDIKKSELHRDSVGI